jgi:hypothetical protein
MMMPLIFIAAIAVILGLAVVLIGSLFTCFRLLAGALSGGMGIALGVSIALDIAEFILFSLAPLMKSIDRWGWLYPFQWMIGNNPFRIGIDDGYTITLQLVTAGLILSAVVTIDRRDISNGLTRPPKRSRLDIFRCDPNSDQMDRPHPTLSMVRSVSVTNGVETPM